MKPLNIAHRRPSLRLNGYDYTCTGAYFVTIVTQGRASLFGDIVNSEMRLNQFGEIVEDTWKWLEEHFDYIELGAWIVMPNHFHGILIINDESRRGGSRTAPTDVKHKSLGRLVGAFKTVSTKKINLLRGTEGSIIWQRNFYDHIIRNQEDLELTWLYIESNPIQWAEDNENPLK